MQNDNEIMVNILKKINQNKIYITQIRNKFSSLEIGLIRKLYDDESIINVFDLDIKEEVVKLTRKGKFIIFSEDNKDKILNFSDELEQKGYKTEFLMDYLKTCDYDNNLDEIFSEESYDLFIRNLEQLQNTRVTRRILIKNRNIG